ncbi:MAG TPA: hypothetical protein VN794_16595, partial [Methylomirabilota bacterium]|nr:hypothetical protein [Methylomirabilota bacterium]
MDRFSAGIIGPGKAGGTLNMVAKWTEREGAGPGAQRACLRLAGAMVWLALLGSANPAPAAVLWTDLAPRVTHLTAEGADLLAGAVKRDD